MTNSKFVLHFCKICNNGAYIHFLPKTRFNYYRTMACYLGTEITFIRTYCKYLRVDYMFFVFFPKCGGGERKNYGRRLG